MPQQQIRLPIADALVLASSRVGRWLAGTPHATLRNVEPSARGLGIGSRLVSECVRFARQARYKKMVLWTQSELDAARHIYKRAGFRAVEKKRHHSFSKNLVAETWELSL